jgi:hypothetical protein
MSDPLRNLSARRHVVPILAALGMCSCATQPPPTVVKAVAPASTAPVEPKIVTMAPIPNPEPHHARESPARLAKPASPQRAAVPTASSAPPVAPARDPKRAAQLRERGLEALNRGAVAQAVSLLTEACRLDPQNGAIRHDLDRAQKIDRAVHGAR